MPEPGESEISQLRLLENAKAVNEKGDASFNSHKLRNRHLLIFVILFPFTDFSC